MVIAEYMEQPYPDWSPDDLDEGRFVLVEASTYGNGFWLSSHPTPEEAAAYHDDQESADDWSIRELVDRETGQRFTAVDGTKWKPLSTAPGEPDV
jgi:hypothetical protein